MYAQPLTQTKINEPIKLWKQGELRTMDYLNSKGFNATETLSKEQQFKDIDIDVIDPRTSKHFTVSVKTQDIANRTGNFSFEEYAVTKDGTKADGNFRKCEADFCAIAVPHQDTGTMDIYFFVSKKLKEFIYSKPRIRKTLSFGGMNSNNSKHFVDFINIIVPIEELKSVVKLIKTVSL